MASSVSVREITSGCICCTVKGNFTKAVHLLVKQEHPDYIVVEPSGAADLSDVVNACCDVEGVCLNRVVLVVNARKQKRLLTVVGPFYLNQIRNARMVYLNFTENMSRQEIEEAKESLWEINQKLCMIEVPLPEITRDSFPEGQADAGDYMKKGSGGLLVRPAGLREPEGTARIRYRGKQELYSCCCQFQGSFAENDIQDLLEIFRQEECADIWRVKGCLKMLDGSVRKIDIVFGDQFQKELDGFDENKVNQLVVAGKKVNTLWLQKQLEKFHLSGFFI